MDEFSFDKYSQDNFSDEGKKVFEDEARVARDRHAHNEDLQGYDEVIAISEGTLNGILKWRYDESINTTKKDKRLRAFTYALSSNTADATIDAQLGPPHLRMVVDGGPEETRFYVNFNSGVFKWTEWGRIRKDNEQKVDNWSIALVVKFKESELLKVPEHFRQRLRFKPGSYSVTQIMVTLSSAQLASIDWSASSMPGLPSDQDALIECKNQFCKFFSVYLQWLKLGPYSVLGYIVKVPDPKAVDVPPSFVPTSLYCRTQEYLPYTDAFKKAFPPSSSRTTPTRGGLDCLLFLEMTDNRRAPTTYDPLKAGNWVLGGVDCSLTMARNTIYERFILPRTKDANLEILLMANDLYHWIKCQENEKYEFKFGLPWEATKNEADRPNSSEWSYQPGSRWARYEWKGENNTSEDWGHKNVSTQVRNFANYVPQQDHIELTFQIHQHKDYLLKGTRGINGRAYTQDTHVQWHIKLRFMTIVGGKLDIKVEYTKPTLESKRSNESGGYDWRNQLPRLREASLDKMKKKFDPEKIKTVLSKALDAQSGLVLPGGKDFNMKDPKYSNEGNVHVNLSLIANNLEIEERFRLYVETAAYPDLNGRWLKIIQTENGHEVCLTDPADKSSANFFQRDNGMLALDDGKGKLTEFRSVCVPPKQEKPRKDLILYPLVFKKSSEIVFPAVDPVEFSLVGNAVNWGRHSQAPTFWNRFYIDPTKKLGLWEGDAPKDPAREPTKPFLLVPAYGS